MNKKFFFLSPVEAVQVTRDNLDEVAEWCGGKVAQTASRYRPNQMDSYVWVPTPKEAGISWAFPNMYITKRLVRTMKGELRATYSVFRRDYFDKNYYDAPLDAVDDTWGREKAEKPQISRGPKTPNFAALQDEAGAITTEVDHNTTQQGALQDEES